MRLRLLLIILIGVIASGLTLYLTGNQSPSPADSQNSAFLKDSKKKKTLPSGARSASHGNKGLLINSKNFYATGRQEARIIARSSVGRADPFGPLLNISAKGAGNHSGSTDGGSSEGVPDLPPPPDTGDGSSGLLPPPPAMGGLNGISDLPPEPGITTDELPLPPESRELSRKLKLNAVIGDHAILAFADKNFARERGLKRYVSLGRGDSYESIRLIDLDADMAIIEENGKTRELKLPELR